MPLESQSVTWKSDGAEVQGWLLKPQKSAGKLPLITATNTVDLSLVWFHS